MAVAGEITRLLKREHLTTGTTLVRRRHGKPMARLILDTSAARFRTPLPATARLTPIEYETIMTAPASQAA